MLAQVGLVRFDDLELSNGSTGSISQSVIAFNNA